MIITRNIRQCQTLRSVTLFFAILSIFSQGLIPAGWMPRARADGALSIEICSTERQQSLAIPADGGNPDAAESSTDGKYRADQACAFAGVVVTTLPELGFGYLPAVRRPPSFFWTAAADNTAVAVAGPPLGSRAPPF